MPPGSSFFLQKARLTEQTTQNTRIFHPISADSNAAAAAADLSTSAAAHQFSEVSLIRARPARPVDSRDESKMEKKGATNFEGKRKLNSVHMNAALHFDSGTRSGVCAPPHTSKSKSRFKVVTSDHKDKHFSKYTTKAVAH